jgi:predicted Zn-dependent protease
MEDSFHFSKTSRIGIIAALALMFQFFAPVIVRAQNVTRLGFFVLGYDLDSFLPDDPTIEQQIAAGQHQLAILKSDESSFDSNREMVEYLNAIVAKLLVTSHRNPLYPITVHFSSVPTINAQSLPGGIIVVEERMFDQTDNEAQLVGVLAHETEHELSNDFMTLWSDYKRKQKNLRSVNEIADSRHFETFADLEGARLMYEAGWDPQAMVDLYKRIRFASGLAHPPNSERIKALETLLAKLPPRMDLIKDSARFRELKQKY